MRKLLLALLVAGAVASCDGTGIENSSPIAIGFLDPLAMFAGQTHEISLPSLFSDPEGDALVYSAASGDPDNLAAEIVADTLVLLEAFGATETVVTLMATDIHGAEASINVETVVRDAIRDDFDTDEGWIGMIVLEQQPNIFKIENGHLVMAPIRSLALQYAWRDIGDGSFGPNWKVEVRVKADAPCYGFMAFSEEFRPPTIPEYVWSFDVDPFGYYLATLSVRGEWQYLAEAYLPDEPGPADGYLQMAMGVTEDSVFYGYAHEDFKLFEFDLKAIPERFGIQPNLTIEHIALTTGTEDTLCWGHIAYDWIELTINEEGRDR